VQPATGIIRRAVDVFERLKRISSGAIHGLGNAAVDPFLRRLHSDVIIG
jgi:hypothetical protein